jgi:PTS system cellobiose-specific IIC component
MGSLGGLLVLVLVQQFLWFFGLHGSNILAPIINAVLLPLTEANVRAFKNGVNPEHIINSQFLDSYVNMGGSGATIALLIAIFIIGKKSKTQKTIANLSIAPGMFNINEPVIFGLPIILNPIYFIPFILAPLASGIIAYVLTFIGFAPKVVVMAHWTTPPILGAIISTNSIRGGITALICMAVSIIIYMPFVHMATKKDQKNIVKVEETHSI